VIYKVSFITDFDDGLKNPGEDKSEMVFCKEGVYKKSKNGP
jgi:hypothetical protein